MPITVLAALVVFGIAGIAVLTVLFGFNKRRSFIDAEDAGYTADRSEIERVLNRVEDQKERRF